MTTQLPPLAHAVETLRGWLAGRTIDGGAGLPSEMTLATRLQVSRGTVRKALAQLQEEGLVAAGRGRGRKVQPVAATGDSAVVVLGAGIDDQQLSEEQEGAVEDACVRAVRAQGSPVLVVDAWRTAPDRALALLGAPPQGIIITHFIAQQEAWQRQARRWLSTGIPVAVYGDDQAWRSFDRVVVDHAAGCQALTAALIADGRRRIVPVWHTTGHPYWLDERTRGYRLAMREAGLEAADPILLAPAEGPPHAPAMDLANLDQRARAYLGFIFDRLQGSTPADALLAVNDVHAFAVMRACAMLGRETHRQVAVSGFDASWRLYWENRDLGMAPWATVHKRNHRVGEALVALLAERRRSPAGRPAILHRLAGELVRP